MHSPFLSSPLSPTLSSSQIKKQSRTAAHLGWERSPDKGDSTKEVSYYIKKQEGMDTRDFVIISSHIQIQTPPTCKNWLTIKNVKINLQSCLPEYLWTFFLTSILPPRFLNQWKMLINTCDYWGKTAIQSNSYNVFTAKM